MANSSFGVFFAAPPPHGGPGQGGSSLFLDSGNQYAELGRHSFLGAWPFLKVKAFREHLEIQWGTGPEKREDYLSRQNALTVLDEFLARFRTPPAPFPFAGGAVGFFSYDLKNELENLPLRPKEEQGIPLWTLAWYDGVIVHEQETGRYWLTACGMQENGECDPALAEEVDQLESLISDFLAGHHDGQEPAAFGQSLPAIPFAQWDNAGQGAVPQRLAEVFD